MTFPATSSSTAILVLTCNRPAYLGRTLASIDRSNRAALPVVISQDGRDRATAAVVRDYRRAAAHLQHKPPEADEEWLERSRTVFDRSLFRRWQGHYRVARHYKLAFRQIFDDLRLESALVIEDDLELAADFFDYMAACAGLLALDPTIRTISAWNDNGRPPLAADPAQLYRTECFPGLGWIMTRSLWETLGPHWPDVFWDDWLRLVFRRQGWVAIMPEVARAYTFGETGVSRGQFFRKYLAPTRLNDRRVDLATLDLGYLAKARYDAWLDDAITAAPLALPDRLDAGGPGNRRLLYHGEPSFAAIARQFGLMPDFREGMPRTSYRGVVTFRHAGGRIFVVPLAYLMARRQP